jgi:histone acetyltransferase
VQRIFINCRTYNQPETIYFKCANDLEDHINPYLNSLNDGTFEVNPGENKRPQQKGSRKKTVDKGAK